MSAGIKRRRGTTAEHETFTGLESELTIDTTKKTVVVHDGVTAGGNPLATEAGLAAGVSEAKTYTDESLAPVSTQLDAKANKEQEDWISPTLVNNWTAVGGFDTPGYFKDEFGFVSLRGLLNSGEGLTAAFTLPEGYRPAQTKYFPVASNMSFGIVRIELNGTVYIDTFTSWVSLESISFRV